MKLIPYILYLFLIAFHLTITSEITAIYGIVIDLAALIVAIVGLYKSETTALWFAFAAAIVVACRHLTLMPGEIVILTLGAVFSNRAGYLVNLESVYSRLLILAVVIFAHQMYYTIIVVPGDLFRSLYMNIIPTLIYTLAISWIFFQFKDGRITWNKIKSLF